MAEYLIQDSTLTSIGNEIRTMKGSSSKMTPATMTSNLQSANTEVNNQTTIMNQILAALETKGDGGLNFKVVGGDTAPGNPVENTIWVNTSTPITSWEFSATQPIASSGKVWICVGTSSSFEFNMLKENTAKMYPLFAKQYVSGAWVAVEVFNYQSGEWVYWWNGELFENGNQYDAVTGGWITSNSNDEWYFDKNDGTRYPAVMATIDTAIRMSCSGGAKCSVAVTAKKVNLTNCKKLFANATAITDSYNLFVSKDKGSLKNGTSAEINITATGIQYLSTEGLDGEYYVGIFVNSSGSIDRSATITEVWVE